MAVIEVTSDNFEQEILQCEKLVLVDMWASWCGPCMRLGPIVEEFAQSQDEVKVCKICVEDEEGLAARFRVMNIPTLLLFQNGEVVKRSVGVIPRAEIEAFVKISE